MIKPASKPIAKAKIASGRKPPEPALTSSSCNGRICGVDSQITHDQLLLVVGALKRDYRSLLTQSPSHRCGQAPLSGARGSIAKPTLGRNDQEETRFQPRVFDGRIIQSDEIETHS
jgi:hypothetical protein